MPTWPGLPSEAKSRNPTTEGAPGTSEALEWDLRDIDEVEREYSYRDGRGSYRTDYALRTEPRGLPALLIEAKALGEDLDDVRWRRQVVHYANDCGVAWAVLTDAEINRRWDDWRVNVTGRDALRRLVSEKDPALVRLLARRTCLTKTEVQRFLEGARDTLFESVPRAEVGAASRLMAGRVTTSSERPRGRRPPRVPRMQLTEKCGREGARAPQRPRGSPQGAREKRAGSQAGALGLPRMAEVNIALLRAIAARGGRVKPADRVDGRTLYDELADHFGLSPRARSAILPSGRGVIAWNNRVQWARQALVSSGHVDGSEHGVWKLTPKGRRVLG